jgi:hypothetical protein
MLQNPRRKHFTLRCMRLAAVLLLAVACLASAPAYAQERDSRDVQGHKQGLVPDERSRGAREAQRRERSERLTERRERRFTPEERQKLRQDLLDANREMHGRRR